MDIVELGKGYRDGIRLGSRSGVLMGYQREWFKVDAESASKLDPWPAPEYVSAFKEGFQTGQSLKRSAERLARGGSSGAR